MRESKKEKDTRAASSSSSSSSKGGRTVQTRQNATVFEARIELHLDGTSQDRLEKITGRILFGRFRLCQRDRDGSGGERGGWHKSIIAVSDTRPQKRLTSAVEVIVVKYGWYLSSEKEAGADTM